MHLDRLLEGYNGRALTFISFILLSFGILQFRLWQVQLQLGDEHKEKIDNQIIRKIRLTPARGRIITSDQVVVADTKPVFDVVMHVSEMRKPGARSNTVKHVASKVIEAAAIMGRLPEAVSKKNLCTLFEDSLNFNPRTFFSFWENSVEVKKKYFGSMTKEEAWLKMTTERSFPLSLEDELPANYLPLFEKIFMVRNKLIPLASLSARDRKLFGDFWSSLPELTNKYFASLSEEAAWEKITTAKYFCRIEDEVSILYRSHFAKIAEARRISDRLFKIFKTGKYAVDLAESWKTVCDFRKEQLAGVLEKISILEKEVTKIDLPSKDETEQPLTKEEKRLIEDLQFQKRIRDTAQRILSIDTGALLTKETLWKRLRFSQRWRNGRRDYKRGITFVGLSTFLSEQELLTVFGNNYKKIVEQSVALHLRKTAALPYEAFYDLKPHELGAISESAHTIRGLEVQINCHRHYQYPEFGSHYLGVTGKRNDEEFKKEKFFYINPELKGKSGVESTYDEELRGEAGFEMLQLDKFHYSHGIVKSKKAVNGNDIILNIDSKAQLAAQKALAGIKKREGEDKEAAIVLLDCRNGAVLAMASNPTFSLPDFDYDELAADKELKPLLNRAMSARYTPGSIVKPLVALGALQSGSMSPDLVVDCTGYHYVDPEKRKGRTRCHSWKVGGHGSVDVLSAIEQSCNPFFNTVGIMTTFDVLRPFFLRAGFGSKTGVDINYSPMVSGEVAGYVATRESKKKATGIRWNSWDTAQFAMGQADTGVTPLQAACYVAAIANGGRVYKPRVVDSVVTSDGTVVKKSFPEVKSSLGVDASYLDFVRQGMWQVVWGDKASAKAARKSPIDLAGKTGTAQVGSRTTKQNTWFICYGPVENPKYACAVVVKNGKSGGRSAAPVATDMFINWLGPRVEERQD